MDGPRGTKPESTTTFGINRIRKKKLRHRFFSKFYHLAERDEPTNGGDNSRRKRKPGKYKINYWEIVGNAIKHWRFTYKQTLWDISYQNLMMLNMSIPRFDKDGNKIEAPTELSGQDLVNRFGKRKQ